MKKYLARVLGVAAATLSIATLLVAVAPASTGAVAAPALSISPFGKVIRGQWIQLISSGLQAGTSYTLTSDHGAFSSSGAHTQTFTPVDANPVYLSFRLPATDPITDFSATLTATGDSTVLASLDLPVAAPSLAISSGQRACPGLSTTVVGKGFVEGGYLLQSASGTTSATPTQSTSGVFSTSISLNEALTGDFTVTATLSGDSSPTASAVLKVSTATLALGQFNDPWSGSMSGSCFAPGELVTLSSSGGLSLPATTTASGAGNLFTLAGNRPDPQVSLPVTLTATGQTSHQKAVLATSDLARAALLPGLTLGGSGYGAVLASSTPGYQFEPNSCSAPIWHIVPDGMQVSWSALPSSAADTGPIGCWLTMQTDGNAVLFSPVGNATWSSGTHVAGSRLVLGDDGALRVLSPTGIMLFNSSIAPSRVSVASSRVHSAVYINGLVQQRAPTAQLERGASRTVYLQRYLAGHWQNMLSRVTDGGGQLAVGFVQATVYQYRLVLVATSTATGATSGSTFR